MNLVKQNINSTFQIEIVDPLTVGRSEGDSFVIVKNGIIKNIQNFFLIRKFILDFKPQVIHLQMTSTAIIVMYLKKMKLIPQDIKYIYTDRGVYPKQYGKWTLKSIHYWIENSEYFITTTFRNQKNYFDNFKLNYKYKEKFHVIENTAGLLYEKYDEVKKQEKDKKFGEKFVIGFIGRYSIQKNWELTLEIAQELDRKYSDLIFIFVFAIETNETDSAYKDLKREILNFENEKIIFENLSVYEVSEIYYLLDLFVMTSKWESFGRTAVEAMARHVPILATDVDGLSEVIGLKDYLYTTTDEFFKRFENLYLNKNEYKKSQEYFSQRFGKNYSLNNNIKKHEKIYESLLQKESTKNKV